MIIRKMSYYKNKQIPHFVRNDDSSFGDIERSSGGFAAATSPSFPLEIIVISKEQSD
ncbi:MAG: hypothetical protein FWD60_03865 [Candidatus Azobacteroides sp.]|nr:hypothetical protein [Candidatus Azobacteroides sp.]